MAYFYEPGAARWRRFTGDYDVRLYRAPKGWSAFADLLDRHPTTGRPFKKAQWWVRETFDGRD